MTLNDWNFYHQGSQVSNLTHFSYWWPLDAFSSLNHSRQIVDYHPANYKPIARGIPRLSIPNKSWSSRFLTPRGIESSTNVQSTATVQTTRTVQSAPSVQNLDAPGVSRVAWPSRPKHRPDHGKRPEQKSPQLHSLLHIDKNNATSPIKQGFCKSTVFC